MDTTEYEDDEEETTVQFVIVPWLCDNMPVDTDVAAAVGTADIEDDDDVDGGEMDEDAAADSPVP